MSTATVKTKQREKLNTLPVMTFNLGRLHQRLTDKDFEKICAQNPDYRIEMTKEGQLIVMMPVGLEGSHRNHKLAARFGSWAESNNLGVAFDASGGLTLPNGAKRSPDAFWIRKDRWEKLSAEERSTFGHICPDFVVELRSKSDRLKPLQNKMSEYLANGARLGWLIDPLQGKVHIYRPDTAAEILERPTTLSGEDVLPGFVLQLDGILD